MVNQSTTIIGVDVESPSDYSLQWNRWYLKPIGAWPTTVSTSKLERVVSVLLIIGCYSSILFTVIPWILQICLEETNLYKKLRAIGPLLHWIMGGIKFTTLLASSNEIRHCVEHLQVDWQIVSGVQRRQVMLRYAKVGRYVSIFCGAFMQGGILSYCLMTGMSTKLVEIGNETKIVHVLPFAFYQKLINTDQSPANEIVLVSQLLSGFIVNSSAVGAFSLAAVFAAHACGQLNILMTRITEMVKEARERDTKIFFKEIGLVVQNHLRILNFISHIEDVISPICFSELFHNSLSTCLIGYYILTEWDEHDYQNLITYFMIMFSMTFNIFLLCYIGEVLTDQCNKVGKVVYMTEWYFLPYKCILDLRMIIARSSVVMKITASKMVHMSICTFSQVLKSSFAYLNLLRETT
ncbi:odorant receptor 82a-like [Megalopta genalis]|uniref:odorant receptor 82a-like n=1 Tax=Megalopta genalis TaxID=115081 RepID=UPI003FD2A07C